MATEFLDKQFIKEFRQVCTTLRAQNAFNIATVPLPQTLPEPDLLKKLVIKDVTDKYLQPLNNAQVDWLNMRTLERNVYWNSGEVKRQEKYTVPKGSQLVRTQLNLAVPAKHKYTDTGVDYIDYKDENGTRYFYYTLPDTYCYEVQETALVISERLKPSHYGGVRLVTTTGYTFYLYIVPMKRFKKIDSQRILATGVGVEYRDIIQDLLSYWIVESFIFNPTDLEVTVHIDRLGALNLAQHILEPTLEYDDTTDYSLADKQQLQRTL